MALEKTIALPNGLEGEYIRCDSYRWDRGSRQCTAILALYVSSSVAASGDPIAAVLAKIRVYGADFDTYFASAVLAALDPTPDPIRHQIYEAAKAGGVSLIPGAGLSALDLSDATDA